MSLLSFIYDPAPWMAEGLCGETDPEIFFPEMNIDGEIAHNKVAVAKALCLSCPVMEECQEYGLDEEYGIWGGLTATDRLSLGRGKGRPIIWPIQGIPTLDTSPSL